jgi:hypothetical protein
MIGRIILSVIILGLVGLAEFHADPGVGHPLAPMG